MAWSSASSDIGNRGSAPRPRGADKRGYNPRALRVCPTPKGHPAKSVPARSKTAGTTVR